MELIDCHAHVAWDIDDGIQSEEDAYRALQNASEDGICRIIATPHFVPCEYSDFQFKQGNERLDLLRDMAQPLGIQIYRGCEMMLNWRYLEMLKNKEYNTLAASDYILVEFDVRRDISDISEADDRLYELSIRGLKPLIAHVERYFHGRIDLDRVKKWIDMGCYIQVNRTSLMGLQGDRNRFNASALIYNGLAHVVASDTHRVEGSRICKLSDAYNEIKKEYGLEQAEILLSRNPLHIINNEALETIEAQKSFFRKLGKKR